MNGFHRYAIYMVPEGDLFRAGSDWLGWDSEAGKVVSQPDVAGLSAKVRDLTSRPRKYGIHGTVKPPFRLADGHSATDLDAAARTFFASQSPVTIPRMELRAIGRFLAIVPSEPSADLSNWPVPPFVGLMPFGRRQLRPSFRVAANPV